MKHNFPKRFVSLLICGVMATGHVWADDKGVEVLKMLNYAQKVTPSSIDNFLYSTYYYSGKKAYNMKAFEIYRSSLPIVDMKVNPSGSSYAVLSANEKKALLTVRGLNDYVSAKPKFEKELATSASALCYTADSRHIVVADGNGSLIFFRSNDGQEDYRISVPTQYPAKKLVASANDFYIAMQTAGNVVIVNQQDKSIRKQIATAGACWIDFSDDNEMLGVLTAGKIEIYDTRTFDNINTIEGLNAATSFCFHPEGKYVTVAEQGRNLNFYNLVDPTERLGFTDGAGSITELTYLKDGKNQNYLVFNATNSLRYRMLANIQPNYRRLISAELERRMAEFVRQRDGETLEQYNNRVNEESIKRHRQLLANEMATMYAGNMVGRAGVSIDKYDAKRGVLTLNIKGTSSKIYKNLSEAEAAEFSNPDELEFRNVQYGLTENDTFEVVYAEIYNKVSGKSLVVDARSQQNLEFLTTETERHLIEDIKFAQREEIKLRTRTEEIVDMARQSNKIEHTAITTNTQIQRTTDASGRNIKNCTIDFEYTVDAAYSLVEDFASGKYKTEDSRAASTMLDAIVNNFSNDFSKYFVEGKKLEITVTGSADSSPIRGKIAYDGCYGRFEEEPYFLDGQLNNTTITPEAGIVQNEQLAFMRGQGVRTYLVQHMKALSSMDVRFINRIELPAGEGSKFRRIKVSFSFVDADI